MSYAVFKRATLAVQRVRLIDEHDADIYNLIRVNTVGGPSLVFHRYHEKEVTKIRPAIYSDSGQLCQEVVGVDTNALYLYCTQGDMPVGIPRRFNADDAFCDCTPLKGKAAAGWLAWQETVIDHPIHTALNNGERFLGRHGLPVDGFCPQTAPLTSLTHAFGTVTASISLPLMIWVMFPRQIGTLKPLSNVAAKVSVKRPIISLSAISLPCSATRHPSPASIRDS